MKSDSLGSFLASKVEEAQRKNPRASLRSLAAKSGISAGAFADLIHGRRSLSEYYAEKISRGLSFTPLEKNQLFSYISAKSRKFAGQRVLAEDELECITGWEHFAILNLLKTKDFDPSPRWIAERLGLTVARVDECLARLLRMEMIAFQKSTLVRVYNSVRSSSEIPSKAVVAAHSLNLLKTVETLQSTPPEVRSVTYTTMAVDVSKIPKAKELIRKFSRSLSSILETGETKEVYNLNVQLVPVTKISGGSFDLLTELSQSFVTPTQEAQ